MVPRTGLFLRRGSPEGPRFVAAVFVIAFPWGSPRVFHANHSDEVIDDPVAWFRWSWYLSPHPFTLRAFEFARGVKGASLP